VLNTLAGDSYENVRQSVAENPSTSFEILKRLLQDPDRNGEKTIFVSALNTIIKRSDDFF